MADFFPEREVLTPLGPAVCWGLDGDNADNPEWIVIIKRTREPWFFRNVHVRFIDYATYSGNDPSPFTAINPKLQRAINRYKENGWL